MNVVNIIKVVSGLGISVGGGLMTNVATEMLTPDNIGKVGKATVKWSGMAVGAMVSWKASEHMNGVIDEQVEFVKEVKANRKERKNLKKEAKAA